nr:RHS repeat-associated core domain-containing protein [Xenorhabdus khoisanae]
MGQYISPDPLNLEGGLNPYGYVDNPVNFVDPFGLAGKDCGNALEQESRLAKQDRVRRHTSSSAEYPKHTRARTQEEAMGLSSKGGQLNIGMRVSVVGKQQVIR